MIPPFLRLAGCLLAATLGVTLAMPAVSVAQFFEGDSIVKQTEPTSARKTLLSWSFEEPDEETEQTEAEDRIVTDRPHFSEASSLVGLGRVQIESGYSFFLDRNSGTTVQTHSFPEPLLRAGLFAEWFEFRMAYNYLIETTRDPVVGRSRLSGSDDIYLGAKLALAEQSGIFPEVALFPQMRAPTGSRAFSTRQVMPGFNLAYSWVLNRVIELECNTQLNRRRDDDLQYYTEFIQTVNVEYELSKRFGAFTEWFCFVPCGALSAQTQHYFQMGFVFFPTSNIQLDIHSAVGLNRPADNLAFSGAGCSVRF